MLYLVGGLELALDFSGVHGSKTKEIVNLVHMLSNLEASQ